jgi:hypothetical protein
MTFNETAQFDNDFTPPGANTQNSVGSKPFSAQDVRKLAVAPVFQFKDSNGHVAHLSIACR